MTPDDALELIQEYARLGMVRYTRHARTRMSDRRVLDSDVRNVLVHATTCTWQTDEQSWKVQGPDLDDDDITVAVVIDGQVVVITVFA